MSNYLSLPPRETLNAEFVRRLWQVADQCRRLIEVDLKPLGLSSSHGRLFGLIADGALAGVPPLQKDVEDELGLAKSSVTNLVQGLERRGLIFRKDSPTDGRAKELHVSEKGWAVRTELGLGVPVWEAALTRALSDAEMAQAVALLTKVGDSHEE